MGWDNRRVSRTLPGEPGFFVTSVTKHIPGNRYNATLVFI